MPFDLATRLVTCDDPAAVARRTAAIILDSAARAVAARGRFRLVLAGGTTPQLAYRLVAAAQADWACWECAFGDERCLPRSDPGRNSLAAHEALLGRVPIPPEQVLPIPAELGAAEAAEHYARLLAPRLPFDLVLLGMGEDGHTASLFPGHPTPEDEALVVAVHDAPKPPADRVSLTPKALAATRDMVVIVTGASKREALAAWRAGADLPVARVAAAGNALVLVDRAAVDL